MSIPLSMIHYEEFSAPKPGKSFLVEIKSSGQTVSVGAEDSLLEALENVEVKVPYMCRAGVCGQCICAVVEGDIEHRDEFLSADEKAQGKVIMPCVSRAQTDRLVLEMTSLTPIVQRLLRVFLFPLWMMSIATRLIWKLMNLKTVKALRTSIFSM